MNNAINIYVAGPLFSVAERKFNKKVAAALKAQILNCVVILPQEFASTVAGQSGFSELVFNHSLKSIRVCRNRLCLRSRETYRGRTDRFPTIRRQRGKSYGVEGM
jgi:hypothetical protein